MGRPHPDLRGPVSTLVPWSTLFLKSSKLPLHPTPKVSLTDRFACLAVREEGGRREARLKQETRFFFFKEKKKAKVIPAELRARVMKKKKATEVVQNWRPNPRQRRRSGGCKGLQETQNPPKPAATLSLPIPVRQGAETRARAP